jgi:hypothetical protein
MTGMCIEDRSGDIRTARAASIEGNSTPSLPTVGRASHCAGHVCIKLADRGEDYGDFGLFMDPCEVAAAVSISCFLSGDSQQVKIVV